MCASSVGVGIVGVLLAYILAKAATVAAAAARVHVRYLRIWANITTHRRARSSGVQ